MDEAASKLRMEINSKPEELDVLRPKSMQLEIEIEAIKREKDDTKLKSLRADLADLKEERNTLNARWKNEKDIVDHIQKVKTDIENFKLEAERAEREGDYGKVAEIRYGKIKEAQEKLEELQLEVEDKKSENTLIKEEVTMKISQKLLLNGQEFLLPKCYNPIVKSFLSLKMNSTKEL